MTPEQEKGLIEIERLLKEARHKAKESDMFLIAYSGVFETLSDEPEFIRVFFADADEIALVHDDLVTHDEVAVNDTDYEISPNKA